MRQGLLTREDGRIDVAMEPHCRPEVEFLADLLRDYLESYLLAALTLKDLQQDSSDRKAFTKAALETGRAEFLAGRIGTAEALSRTTLENAVLFLIDQKYLIEQDRKLTLGPALQSAEAREAFASELRQYLNRRRA